MKKRSSGDYAERIMRAIEFLERSRANVPSLEELAEVASFSPFHFHRLFRAFVGETVAVYCKRLRLESAVSRLVHGVDEVTVIALDAGFETPSAFSKAVKAAYGCTPRDIRNGKGSSPFIGRDRGLIENKSKPMKCELRTFDAIEVYYVRKTGVYSESAKAAFEALMPFAYGQRVIRDESRVFGICHDDPKVTDGGRIRYEACLTRDVVVEPTGDIGVKSIEGGRYAVFLHKGPYDSLIETYDGIFGAWLPESGESLREVPSFEEYLNRDPRRTKPENLRTLIYIPVR